MAGTMQAPPLGSVNGFMATPFWVGAVMRVYNGTTLGLVLAALDAGVRVGDEVEACYRGRRYVMVAQGGGARTPGGVWLNLIQA